MLGFGFTVLAAPASFRNLFGIFVALCGMVTYGVVELEEKKRAAELAPASSVGK